MDKRASFTIRIDQVKRAHEEIYHGHWFSVGAMRFFNSRWAQTATLIGTKAYFVSSDQFRDGIHSNPRRYSVRVCDMATGDIKTVGEFQAYASGREADAAIKKIVEEASQWVTK
jgi:hypothetical protein